MNHRPRKRFGQNFLQSQVVIDKILSFIPMNQLEPVIEIGPGLGALTKYLLLSHPQVTAIEIDRDLCAHLQETYPNLQLINADALTVDYHRLGLKLHIIGNLPYNISTPLLLYLLNFLNNINEMVFMLQKEVVNRISAEVGTKEYGRLSIMLQYYCQVDWLMDVPPEAFFPQPKVNSAVVRLLPYKKNPYEPIEQKNFETLLACAFAMRRKTIANNLKTLISSKQLEDLTINPGLRPEQLSIAEYVKISQFLSDKLAAKSNS